MFDQKMRNEKGFTLIEMLLAMTLGVVVMGVAIFTYNKQSSVLRTGNQETHARGMARLAMDALVTNIQMAGSGMPPGNSKIHDGASPPNYTPRNAIGISQASSTSITYRANTDNVTTFLARDTTSLLNSLYVPQGSANTGDPATTFSADDQVIIFDVSAPEIAVFPRKINSITTSTLGTPAVTYDKIALVGPHGVDLKPVRDSIPVVVSQYHEITITFDSVAQTITLEDDMGTDDGGGDDTRTIIANNVTNLTFAYFNNIDLTAATVAGGTTPLDNVVDVSTPLDWTNGVADQNELGSIRAIAIDLTIRDQDEAAVTTTLTSGATLRNMGI